MDSIRKENLSGTIYADQWTNNLPSSDSNTSVGQIDTNYTQYQQAQHEHFNMINNNQRSIAVEEVDVSAEDYSNSQSSNSTTNQVEEAIREKIEQKKWEREQQQQQLQQQNPTVDYDIDTVAFDVLQGQYSNWPERETLLTDAGYDYDIVQGRVNELLPIYLTALEVIEGNYSSGEERKQLLEAAGYNYYEVQNMVNQILNIDVVHPTGTEESSNVSPETPEQNQNPTVETTIDSWNYAITGESPYIGSDNVSEDYEQNSGINAPHISISDSAQLMSNNFQNGIMNSDFVEDLELIGIDTDEVLNNQNTTSETTVDSWDYAITGESPHNS